MKTIRKKEKNSKEESIDGKLNLEAELINALEEIDSLGGKNKKKKEQL
jgi:hypothetical protein